jgi:hypothetical protein
MAIEGKYFPSQNPTEQIYLVLRRSFFSYIPFIGILFLMILPLVFLTIIYFRYPEVFENQSLDALIVLVGSAYLLFIVGIFLYGFIDYYLDVYIITNERIVDIKQTGFFRREINELHLREVQDVSARVKGFFPTIFHFGDIFIQTAGERENFIFVSIPHPYTISKKIIDLHQAQIEKDYLRLKGESKSELKKEPEEEKLGVEELISRQSFANGGLDKNKDEVVNNGSTSESEKNKIIEQYLKKRLSSQELIPESLPKADTPIEIGDNYIKSENSVITDNQAVEIKEGEVVQF